MASALFYDIKTITSPDSNENNIIIDKNKVRRERTKARNEVMSKINNNDCNLRTLYFDGRVDDTLCINKTEDGKMHCTTVKEGLISLIQEPNLQFLGYTTPLTGKAVDIANSIIEYTAGNNITLSGLVCIGCNGCPTNTSKYNGVIRTLEQRLGRPLQWVICQQHK